MATIPTIGGALAGYLARARNAYTPYVAPVAPPTGTYDPNLDAQSGAVSRGLGYTLQGIDTAGSRAEEDYGQQKHSLTAGRDQSLADLLSSHTRAGQDFDTSGKRIGEDHATNLATIDRNYQRLGASQAGAAIQQGVATEGGTLAAALKARTANQDIDNTAENTSFGRATDDLNTSRTREGEDYTTQTGRVSSYYDDPTYGAIANAGTQYQRGVDDRANQSGQAGIEATAFGVDTGAQKNFQAQQAGYVAPAKPSNEFSDAKGSYKVVIRGTRRYKVRPDGSEEYAGAKS